jgi:hypothetical protein
MSVAPLVEDDFGLDDPAELCLVVESARSRDCCDECHYSPGTPEDSAPIDEACSACQAQYIAGRFQEQVAAYREEVRRLTEELATVTAERDAARKALLENMTDEERLEAMAAYCGGCGRKQPDGPVRWCQCSNDE